VFLIVDLWTVIYTSSVDVSKICLSTKFSLFTSSASLLMAIKPESKDNIHTTVLLYSLCKALLWEKLQSFERLLPCVISHSNLSSIIFSPTSQIRGPVMLFILSAEMYIMELACHQILRSFYCVLRVSINCFKIWNGGKNTTHLHRQNGVLISLERK
jgi:hypothetical protein